MGQTPAVRRLVAAWTDAGPAPHIHRAAIERLEREWPTLARAIREVVAEARD